MSDETPAERVSRFREHTNTNSSIRPPPDELWKDLGLDVLLDGFSDENASAPAVKRAGHPRHQTATATATTTTTTATTATTAATTATTTTPAPMTTATTTERRIAQPRASATAARKGSDA
ncbi:hypothetical protein SVAN01_11772, partial [Stagonosporopsis vannaccii]